MKAVRRILPVLIAIGIWILSSDPAPRVLPPLFPGQDKILHLLEFSVLGLALSLNKDLTRGSVSPFLVAGLLWAGLDEIHQAYVPGRDCSTGDFLADCAGLAAGFALCAALSRRAGRSPRKALMFRERS